MKHCPHCRKNYDDDSYEFCLEDGAVLVEVFDSQTPTVAFTNEQETVIRNNPVQPTRPDFLSSQYQNSVPIQVLPLEPPPQVQPAPPKSNTARTVLLTILGMLALFGAGFGAWYFLGERQPEIAENKNIAVPNVNKQSPSPKPSPEATKQTPSPTPEIDAKQIKSEVSGTIDDWKSATESLDLDAHIAKYADRIDYYNKSNVSRSTVKTDRSRAFSKYDSMQIDITNLSVSTDANGESATAVFDKEWEFSNAAGDYSSGKVKQRLTLKKIGGRWLINGEKDLQVYRK